MQQPHQARGERSFWLRCFHLHPPVGAKTLHLGGRQAGGLPLPGGPRLPSGQLCCCPSPGISLIMWNALYTAEKVIIRWTLLTEACYFAVQFLGE